MIMCSVVLVMTLQLELEEMCIQNFIYKVS